MNAAAAGLGRALAIVVVAGFGSSCARIDAESTAVPDLPSRFTQVPDAPDAHWPGPDPFQPFGSEQLDALIARGDRSNLDLGAMVARVRQADAHARAAGAALLPMVDAAAAATRFSGGSGGTTAHETDWSALLSASYEVDFWGKNRAAAESAQSLAKAGRSQLATVRMTTRIGIANSYFQLLSLRERLEIARSNLETATQLLAFVEARYAAGRMTPSELAAQRAAVANAQLVIPQLQQQELEALGSLSVLVGAAPEGFTVKTEPLASIHELTIAPGLPAELLQRRPDVAAAEENLRAANADLRSVRAAVFPTLDLTIAGGVQNPAVQAAVITLTGTGFALNVGASAAQSLFDGGRRRAVIEETRQRREELLANYRQSVLAALLDVENALGQIAHLDQQRESQDQNLAQSERAFEGARLRHREGSGQFVSVLEAQRVLYAAREQFGQYRLNRLQADLSLLKALGGGWQTGTTEAGKRP